ncbi:uncharacterized protein B0H64DRAFT_119326 [Chaetomium fimeti]|uniref:Uncharacterized protein n=1 Tax=Chaetomium fimeti TaxID=1854472 RepID=A0AAE0LUC7_9PEZI|nr:hypothetical protein B0H64DRAFT_119326 [Chaetomium fimeti]
MSPPTEIGSSKSGRDRHASVSDAAALTTKDAAAKQQQAPVPPVASDPVVDDDIDVDAELAALDQEIETTAADKEQDAREKKRLRQEAKDSNDQLDAIRNATGEGSSDLATSDDDHGAEAFANETLEHAKGIAADKAEAEKVKQQLINDLDAAKDKIVELQETEKRLTSELEDTKADKERLETELAKVKEEKEALEEKVTKLEEDKEDLEKQLAKLKEEKEDVEKQLAKLKEEKEDVEKQLQDKTEEHLNELRMSTRLRQERDTVQQQLDQYKRASDEKLKRVAQSLKRANELLKAARAR